MFTKVIQKSGYELQSKKPDERELIEYVISIHLSNKVVQLLQTEHEDKAFWPGASVAFFWA